MKKIGLICLALVLTLGALGVTYSAWTDTVTINATVQTGSVDLDVQDMSGTDVYKLEDGSLYRIHWYNVRPEPPAGSILIAHAIAEETADDEVTVTFDNLFPCIDFVADFEYHCAGSVPVNVKYTQVIKGIPESWVTITRGWPSIGDSVPIVDGYQLHYCDMDAIYILIHVPQEDAAMNVSGTITMTLEAIQFNEYP